MSDRVTIKSIARDLGVSHMTVSRALSNHPNVQGKTRAAVLRRATELGYVKSAAASAMRGDSTKIVGLLLPNIVNEFYARFADTLAQECAAHGHHLIIHLTNDDLETEHRSIRRLQEVQAMAVIMVPAPGGEVVNLPDLRAMQVVQLIRRRSLATPAASVLVNDGDAIRDAVAHLVAGGHRRIAYVGADTALSSGRARLDAFRAGLQAADLDARDDLMLTAPPSFEMGRRCAHDVLRKGEATAIVCGGIEISNGALSVVMEQAGRLRGRVAFIGYGDPSFYAWVDGGVSTIRVPVDDLARRAMACIANRTHVTTAPAPISLDAELVVRGDAR